MPYYHLVFTLPAPIATLVFQNKAAIYGLLFRTAAATLATIAGDPKHLGARIDFTAVLHTWGAAMTHHPHLHIIALGGGLSPDDTRWIPLPARLLPARPRALTPVPQALPRGTRRRARSRAARLLHGDLAHLAEADAFAAMLTPLRRADWIVYAKRRFGGPEAMLAYLARYTHRVAIANSRLVAMPALSPASGRSSRRRLRPISVEPRPRPRPNNPIRPMSHRPCPCCGGRMILVERFAPGSAPRTILAVRIDTS